MPVDRPRPAREWPIPPMDHAPGDKASAFSWPMGHLILQRIADGETMKAITADARMPAYCTVFRWMQVVPEFGETVAKVRGQLAANRLAALDAAAVARTLESADLRQEGARVRWWVSGRASTYEPAWAAAVCAAVANGASLSAVLSRADMPSAKAFYRWLRKRPELRAQYVEACRRRAVGLDVERDMVVERMPVTGGAAADRDLRRLAGRKGRLTPKLYRAGSGARPK